MQHEDWSWSSKDICLISIIRFWNKRNHKKIYRAFGLYFFKSWNSQHNDTCFLLLFFHFFFHFLSCSFFLLNLDLFRLFPNSTRLETIGGAKGANELGKEVNSNFLFCFLDQKKICVDYAKVFKIFYQGFFGRVLGDFRDNFMQYALHMM